MSGSLQILQFFHLGLTIQTEQCPMFHWEALQTLVSDDSIISVFLNPIRYNIRPTTYDRSNIEFLKNGIGFIEMFFGR